MPVNAASSTVVPRIIQGSGEIAIAALPPGSSKPGPEDGATLTPSYQAIMKNTNGIEYSEAGSSPLLTEAPTSRGSANLSGESLYKISGLSESRSIDSIEFELEK